MKILRLKATLLGVKPPIWRRLEVPANLTLLGLHQCLQAAFGWEDSHMHDFEIDGLGPIRPDPEIDIAGGYHRELPLAELEGRVKAFGYIYDFGDDWIHRIEIEAWTKAVKGVIYPRCTEGARACPPEDCGGDQGYMELIEILKDRHHERYGELREWVGSRFAPEVFDLSRANAALKKVKTPSQRPESRSWTWAPEKPRKSKLDSGDKAALLDGMAQEFKNAGAAITPELQKALMGLVEMKLNRVAGAKRDGKPPATRRSGR